MGSGVINKVSPEGHANYCFIRTKGRRSFDREPTCDHQNISQKNSKRCIPMSAICYDFLREGRCRYGDGCRYTHEESSAKPVLSRVNTFTCTKNLETDAASDFRCPSEELAQSTEMPPAYESFLLNSPHSAITLRSQRSPSSPGCVGN